MCSVSYQSLNSPSSSIGGDISEKRTVLPNNLELLKNSE
jgi:hypothetical protein